MAENNTTNLSLDELDSEETVTTTIESGDGTKELEDVKDKLEGKSEEPDEEEENEDTDEKTEEESEVEEEKEEEEEENEDDTKEVEQFFEQLSTEVGFNVNDLEIDFEGEDPLSPKGIHKVIDAIKDQEVNNFDAYLKSNYPDAYQHFLALQGGMSSEDYFKSREGGVELVPSEQQVSDSLELQKELIKEDLIAKGIKKESIIAATLKDLEENDELLSEALEIRTSREESRNQRFQELEDKASQKVKAETELTNTISA